MELEIQDLLSLDVSDLLINPHVKICRNIDTLDVYECYYARRLWQFHLLQLRSYVREGLVHGTPRRGFISFKFDR